MNWRVLAGVSVYSALGLAACNGSSSGTSALVAEESVAPVAATGPACAGIRGDPPQPLTNSFSANGDLPFQLLQLCTTRGGESLTWTDPTARPVRPACTRPGTRRATSRYR